MLDATSTPTDAIAYDATSGLDETPSSWVLEWPYPGQRCTCDTTSTCASCRQYCGARWRSLPRHFRGRKSQLSPHHQELSTLYAAGTSLRVLGARYGVNSSTIRAYLRGRNLLTLGRRGRKSHYA